MLENENKSDNKAGEGGYKIVSLTFFILIFGLIVIVFIYQNINISKLSKNAFLDRIFNYFEKKTATAGTRDTTLVNVNSDSVATIFKVELNHELNGTEDFPQLFIDGVNNKSRGYLLKLLIQIGRRLTGKYVVSSLDTERKASAGSSNANDENDANDANVDNVENHNGNGKGTANDLSLSFYSLIDIELKTTSFSSPIPVKNFTLLTPNHLYDLRILTHKDDDGGDYHHHRRKDNIDDDDAVGDKIVYDKILFEGSVRLKINLFNFKPLLITKDAILLYDRLEPFKSVDNEEKDDKDKDVYVSYPESIFKKRDYIENFPNLKPITFPPAHKPLNLQRGCKFLSEVRVLNIDNDEESGDKAPTLPPPPSSFSSSFHVEYDERDVSEGKTSVLQNPNNELEYYVLLLKNSASDRTFPRGWSLSYKSESNGAIYEQIYTLDTVLKSGFEKEMLIKNQKLLDVISEKYSSSPQQNFKVNNLALDHCVGITYDSLTPDTFKLLAPSPPPTKSWFEQSPFLGVSMKTGDGLIYVTQFINSSTCHKSLFRGSFSPEDSSLFFLNKKRGHPVSCHPVNRHFCKANSSSSGTGGVEGSTFGEWGSPPDHLEIMALISKSHNPMPLLSLSPSSTEIDINYIDCKRDLMKIAPFPFFTQSVTNPYNNENFQSSSAAVGITVTEHFFNLPHIRYTLLNGAGGGGGDNADARDRAVAAKEKYYYVYNVPYPKFEYRHAISPSYTTGVVAITREFFLNGQTRSITHRRSKERRRKNGIVYGIPAAPPSPRSPVRNVPSCLYLAWWTKTFTPGVARKLMGKQTCVRFEDVTSGSFFNANSGAALITDKWAAYSSSVLKITNEHQFLNVEFLNGPLIGQKAPAYFLMTLTPIYRLSNFFFYSTQDTIMKNPSISETEEKKETAIMEGLSYVLAIFQRQRSGNNLLVLIYSRRVTLYNYDTFNKNPPSGYIGPLKPKEMYYLRLDNLILDESFLENSTKYAILLMSFAEYLHYIQCIDRDDIGEVFKRCLKRKLYPNGLCFIPRHHYEKFVDLNSFK